MIINYKKVATILGSALMIGSTVGLAAAASYPAPFVKSGSSDVAIVVGANAAPSDVAAAAKVSSGLATELAAQTATGGSSTVEGGDSAKIEKSSDKFNFGDTISGIDSSLDKKDLPTLLADGTYLDDDNDEFDYKQSIDLGALSLGLFDDDEYARDSPTVGFDVAEGTYVLNYTLDFTDTPLWQDLQTTELPILGKMYYVLSTSSNNTITLLDSAASAELDEGETVTLTVGSKTYEVSARVTDANSVKLTINGQTTNTLDEAETQRLSDGAYVGIKDISYNSKDSGVSSVEFSIGSGKLILENGNDVELNDETIDNLAVTITNVSNTQLDKITLTWSAEQDSWITPTSSIEMPGFNAIKVAFGGMNYPASEEVVVKADGDDNIVLSNFPLAGGATESINLLYSDGSNFTIVGKDSNNKLAVSTNANGTLTFTKNVDDYFAVTYISGEDAESYLVRATNWDDADYPDNVVDFEYLTASGWTSLDSDVNASDEVEVGGDAVFTVNSVSNESSSATIRVTAGTNTYFDRLVSEEGLQVLLPYYNQTAQIGNSTNYSSAAAACTAYSPIAGQEISQLLNFTATGAYGAAQNQTTCYGNTFVINFTEEDKDDAIAQGNSFNVSVGLDSDSEVYITGVGGDGTPYEVGESDKYLSYVTSALNTEISDDQSGDHETVTITYHGGESFADVYVTAPDAKVVSGSGSGSLGTVVYTDAEASSYAGKNLVVVGGSCINSVAAELLGGKLCESGFSDKTGIKAGEALIQSFSRSGKSALLVAGYNAADTDKAVTYLVNNGNKVDTSSAKLKVTSTTEATAITA